MVTFCKPMWCLSSMGSIDYLKMYSRVNIIISCRNPTKIMNRNTSQVLLVVTWCLGRSEILTWRIPKLVLRAWGTPILEKRLGGPILDSGNGDTGKPVRLPAIGCNLPQDVSSPTKKEGVDIYSGKTVTRARRHSRSEEPKDGNAMVECGRLIASTMATLQRGQIPWCQLKCYFLQACSLQHGIVN